jgi:AraC-like DNA-binding protein
MLSRSSAGGRLTPDSVSEILHDLRVAAASVGRYEMTAPYGLVVPPNAGARFHLVVEGGYWLAAANSSPVRMEAGDVALLPRGTGHLVYEHAGEGDVPTWRLEEMPLDQVGEAAYRLRTRGRGPRSIVLCCILDFDMPSMHPLLELMPEVLLLRSGAAGDPSLSALLESMAAEMGAERIGAATVATRLADIVVARVVRAWVEGRTEQTTGWLGALRDPVIGRALAAIHRDPGQPWSVESLASLTNLSRSAFSERFTDVVGASPAHYVARWRMHVAGNWLRHDRRTVAEVAARLGYESEASFSRAFKRVSGVPPGVVRRSDSSSTAAA